MKKTIHTLFVVVLLAQGEYDARAGSYDTTIKKSSVKTRVDSVSQQKICSCQLMNVQTTAFTSELVGIFAEKTLEGKQSNNYRMMDEYIRREKIYFTIAFTRSTEKKGTMRSNTNCLALYQKLKKENQDLRLYNVLDVDILSSLAKR